MLWTNLVNYVINKHDPHDSLLAWSTLGQLSDYLVYSVPAAYLITHQIC